MDINPTCGDTSHGEILGRRCEFNPLRFFDGISTFAKYPNMLRAFGKGLRACIGQNFAMLETKTKIALMFEYYVWFFGFQKVLTKGKKKIPKKIIFSC